MDRRSLVFAFALSTAFFGVQSWFASKDAAEKKIAFEKAEEKRLNREKEIERELAERLPSLDELPIVSLFKDAKGKTFVGEAIQAGELFFTTTLKGKRENNLFVRIDERFLPIHLATDVDDEKSPIVYTLPYAKKVSLPTISLEEPTDVQLVTFNDEKRIVLGEQRGENFSIPYHFLDEKAIAVVKQNQSYLPVGIFDPEAKKVKALHDFQKIQTLVKQDPPKVVASGSQNEEFFVLENAYQQIVFSTKGGAITEINLPFKSEKNPESLVNEVDVDRDILKDSPQNARFPLFAYKGFVEGKEVFQQEVSLGGYYPMLRRPILGKDGKAKTPFSSQFYAMNVISENSDVANMHYRVTRFEPNLITFEGKTGQRRIVKTFKIPEERNGPYCLEMDLLIEGNSNDLWLSSGLLDVELVGGSYSPSLRYQTLIGSSSDVDSLSLPKTGSVIKRDIDPNWLSNSNGYFGIIQDPLTSLNSGAFLEKVDGKEVPTRLSLIDAKHHLYPAADFPGYLSALPLKGNTNLTFRIFAGPFDESLLRTLDELYDDPVTHYNPEYTAAQSIQGWFSFISEPFSKFLFLLMKLFHAATGSWAIAIVLLTIALKAMMYPLNAWSIRSSIKMKNAAPKIKAVQEKYKNDPKRMQMEVMALYKKEGANPLMGCLPMLLQMPFMVGMFYLLKSAFPLRGAVFIPGWIDNLAAPDVLFSWGQPLWFIGNEFHLLPILTGATMFLQQKFASPMPQPGATSSDAEKQQKMMGLMLPIVITVMFYSLPSGLSIYFMFSTLLGVLQQWWMTKKGA